MTNPKYWPRELSAEPDVFGRSQNRAWNPPQDGDSKATYVAARLQHFYAVRIRVRMVGTDTTLKSYFSQVGQRYDRTAKMLRGEVVMRLEDIAAADVVLGPVIEFTIADANRRKQAGPAGQAPTR